jgi:hypothetical protein
MHSLPQPILPTGITIVLWCVCSGAAALVQPSKNNEPQQLPDSPTTPFTVVVRTIPITKELAFEERWRVPAPETMPPTASHFGSNLTSGLRSMPSPAIRSAATRVAATFTLLEFCHGSPIDEQQPQRRRAIWLAEAVEFRQD